MRAAALLAMIAAPVAAQDCAAQLSLLSLSGIAVEAEGSMALRGWCEAAGVTLGAVPVGEFGMLGRVDALRWRGEGLDALVAGAGLPTAIEVEMEGLRLLARTGEPTMTWLIERQAARSGIDGSLALRWDAGTRDLHLAHLRVDFPGDGALVASGRVAGLDLTSEAALMVSLGHAGLARLDLDVAVKGLFEAYALMPLGAAYLGGAEDPAAEAEALKALVIAEVGRLPEAVFPGATRGAMAAFVADLPNPWGDLSLDLQADPPLGAPRFARLALTGAPGPGALSGALWPALEGVTVAVGWAPSTPPG